MSRFKLYGGARCENCIYYRRSSKCPVWRCDHDDNLGSNWIGTTYKRSPDQINMFYKCKWFKEKEND